MSLEILSFIFNISKILVFLSFLICILLNLNGNLFLKEMRKLPFQLCFEMMYFCIFSKFISHRNKDDREKIGNNIFFILTYYSEKSQQIRHFLLNIFLNFQNITWKNLHKNIIEIAKNMFWGWRGCCLWIKKLGTRLVFSQEWKTNISECKNNGP